MCADVPTDNSMAEGMGVNAFEMALNVSAEGLLQIPDSLAPETKMGLHEPGLLTFGVKCQVQGGIRGRRFGKAAPSWYLSNGERKRATCGREFGIKGGCVF